MMMWDTRYHFHGLLLALGESCRIQICLCLHGVGMTRDDCAIMTARTRFGQNVRTDRARSTDEKNLHNRLLLFISRFMLGGLV